MMSLELRQRWAAALREPDRVQGRRALCTVLPDGTKAQCCLDVLIELFMDDNPGVLTREVQPLPDLPEQGGGRVVYISPDGTRDGGYLPEVVAEWAGTNISPLIGDIYAGFLNDAAELTFPEIADRIDAADVIR